MTRIQVEGLEFDVAFGVDHVTSSFVEVWTHPIEDQDAPLVSVNNTGVYIYKGDEDEVVRLPLTLLEAANKISRQFEMSRQNGNLCPNIDYTDADRLVRAVGFTTLTSQIAEAYD